MNDIEDLTLDDVTSFVDDRIFNHDIPKITRFLNYIKNKDVKNPVTAADLEVNDLILKGMQEKYQNVGGQFFNVFVNIYTFV